MLMFGFRFADQMSLYPITTDTTQNARVCNWFCLLRRITFPIRLFQLRLLIPMARWQSLTCRRVATSRCLGAPRTRHHCSVRPTVLKSPNWKAFSRNLVLRPTFRLSQTGMWLMLVFNPGPKPLHLLRRHRRRFEVVINPIVRSKITSRTCPSRPL